MSAVPEQPPTPANPHVQFVSPCPNCGAKDRINSLQSRFLEREAVRKGSIVGYEGFGFKLLLDLGGCNPDARFLRKNVGPKRYFWEQAIALTFFLASVFSGLLAIFSAFLMVAIYLRYSQPPSVSAVVTTLTSLPFAALVFSAACKIRDAANKSESEYWKTFERMTDIAVCGKCGKILGDVSPLS